MDQLAAILIIVGLATIFYWTFRTLSDNHTRRKLADTRAALHRDLVNRFGTSEELLAYLSSEAGRDLLLAADVERPNPFKRILGAVQTGIVLVAVGIAFLALRNMAGLDGDGETGFTFLGTMALAVGVGFLGSATASWLLSRRFGLIAAEPRRAAADTAEIAG